MKRNVYLQGELGERFGESFTVMCNTPRDIFKCIAANRPEFKPFMLECVENGTNLDMAYEGQLLEENQLENPLNSGDVYISLVPAGSKSGLGKIFAAIVLGFVLLPAIGASSAAAASFVGPVPAGAAGLGHNISMALTTKMGVFVKGLAVNLALTGIQQVMAPDPAVDASNPQNYLFDGDTQNIQKGDPIPILYGELRIPGRPIATNVQKGVFINPNSIMVGENDFAVQNTALESTLS